MERKGQVHKYCSCLSSRMEDQSRKDAPLVSGQNDDRAVRCHEYRQVMIWRWHGSGRLGATHPVFKRTDTPGPNAGVFDSERARLYQSWGLRVLGWTTGLMSLFWLA